MSTAEVYCWGDLTPASGKESPGPVEAGRGSLVRRVYAGVGSAVLAGTESVKWTPSRPRPDRTTDSSRRYRGYKCRSTDVVEPAQNENTYQYKFIYLTKKATMIFWGPADTANIIPGRGQDTYSNKKTSNNKGRLRFSTKLRIRQSEVKLTHSFSNTKSSLDHLSCFLLLI